LLVNTKGQLPNHMAFPPHARLLRRDPVIHSRLDDRTKSFNSAFDDFRILDSTQPKHLLRACTADHDGAYSKQPGDDTLFDADLANGSAVTAWISRPV
jgi:hypothetical protein